VTTALNSWGGLLKTLSKKASEKLGEASNLKYNKHRVS
jgi:hypothetical protein